MRPIKFMKGTLGGMGRAVDTLTGGAAGAVRTLGSGVADVVGTVGGDVAVDKMSVREHEVKAFPDRAGVALSGGGIRSASFNLGVLQCLKWEGVFEQIHYISAVSGGAYMASTHAIVHTESLKSIAKSEAAGKDYPDCFFGSKAEREFGARPVYSRNTPEEEHIRNNSSYIAPTPLSKVGALGVWLRGFLLNMIMVAACLFAAGVLLGWLFEVMHPGLNGANEGVVNRLNHIWIAALAGGPVLFGFLFFVADTLLPFTLRKTDVARVWSRRLITLGVVAGLVLAIPYVLVLLRTVQADTEGFVGAIRTGLGVDQQPEVAADRQANDWILLVQIIVAINAVVAGFRFLSARKRSIYALIVAALAGPFLLLLPFLGIVNNAAARGVSIGIAELIAVATGYLLLDILFNCNKTTLHYFYAHRLATEFAIRRSSPETADRLDDYDVELKDYQPATGPKYIYCAAANAVADGTAPPGRNAVPFNFSADTDEWVQCGGTIVGRISPEHLGRLMGGLTVPAVAAISGAAVSPTMGKYTRRLYTFLLTLLNVRLGLWLPNPHFHYEGNDRRGRNDKWRARLTRWSITRSPMWPKPGLRYLMYEFLGWHRLDRRYLYVTDGGHYDNLGLVELLRLGCTKIYCFDASGDTMESFNTLGEAIAIARTDLGVSIEIDPTDLLPHKDSKLAKHGHVIGNFFYPAPPGNDVAERVEGQLIFVKAAVTEDSPWDLRAFREKDRRFPNHSTMDQLFTDQKFESYRALGAHQTVRALKGLEDFEERKRRLQPRKRGERGGLQMAGKTKERTGDSDYRPRGDEVANKPDYGRRNRKFEWRDTWFHLHRSRDDEELNRTLINALELKGRLINEQRHRVDHRAAYSPSGPGTPWFSVGPRNTGGRVKSLAVHPTDPNTVYAAAAAGGVWKTTDGAQSWRPLWDEQESLAVGAIAIAPTNPSVIYAGTGEWTPGYRLTYPGAGVYLSTDGGVTWALCSGLQARRVSRILVSPTDANTLYVAGPNGFERSTDGGVTWTTLRAGATSDAVIDPSNANIICINVSNDRIYKTTDGGTTWTGLAAGPTGAAAYWVKLAIGVAGTNGSDFLVAKSEGTVYKSTDGGTTWTTIAGSHGAGWTGWCDMVAVGPDDEDIIIVGGIGIERTTDGGTTWAALAGLHADHHVTVFAPSNPTIVYESNDGGVYRSSNKGATFRKASHGLVVTQFYDIGSWGHISTVLGGGTQDNGTNMSTGGLTWRNILGADGGYFLVHPTDPRTMYAETQNTDVRRSTDGGNTWIAATAGLSDGTPWVGVMTMDQTTPTRLFIGTTRIFRSTDGLVTPWVVSSQILNGTVSAIAIAPSDGNRVYAGAGTRVYRSDDAGATSPWTDITTPTLPSRMVTDLDVDRGNRDRVIVTYGSTALGSAANHVFLSTNAGGAWTNLSGNLPNISVNAVALDPNAANTIYVGTDAGAYRTIDGGVTWQAFDNGMPNVVITDLHVDAKDNMLYAATFGRGMYKVGIAAAAVEPPVDLYLRDSLLDTGERFPSASNEPNPNDLSDQVYWWESPDIKTDVTPYFSPDGAFDGVEFDEDLLQEDPKRTEVNRFYLQVHNRGWQSTSNARVRAFFANASAGLPPLPNALTPPDFNLSSTADWQPIGPPQTIPLLEPNRPVIVSWDWTVPSGAATHSCLLAVVSSADDPITTSEINVDLLVSSEKRVALKNLHVVNSVGPRPAQALMEIEFHNARARDDVFDIIVAPVDFAEGTIGLLLEPVDFASEKKALFGVTIYPLREGEYIGDWYVRPGDPAEIDKAGILQAIDRTRVFEFDASKVSELRGVKIPKGERILGVLTTKGSHKVPYGQTQQFSVLQRQDNRIVGGSTYEVRLRRARAKHPVSRLRISLDKIQVLSDRDPWLKGRGEFHFGACIIFNDDPNRRHWVRVPQHGTIKVGSGGMCQLKCTLFEGYVAEKDNMSLALLPVEHDWLEPDDELCRYRRRFNYPPEQWVGSFGPDDEPAGSETERLSDWALWYRIESLSL